MNALRTASIASRAVRTFLTLAFLALAVGLVQSKPLAAPLSFHSVTGQALALNAALRSAHILQAAPANSSGTAFPTQQGPNGRTLFNHQLMHPGAVLKSRAVGTAIPVPVAGAVQTSDLFNPSPGFQPLVGYQNADGSIGNNPQNKPLYIPALASTNLTPVWSADESFIVFSSNRTADGKVQPDGRFHLWAIAVTGGQAFQITTSTGLAGGGEFFPALSGGNNQYLAFTSDAQTQNVQNLYFFQFSVNNVLLGTSIVNVSDTTQISSFTNVAGTGFDQVQRPTIYGNLIVFSAHSTTGAYAGHNHIYFLNITTGGFDPNNNSLPAKLTDGPADDTDPAYSNEGQFLAFASTATHIQNQDSLHNSFSSNPDTSQTLTTVPATPSVNRNLFLLSGNSTATGFGTGVAPRSGTTSSNLPIYAPITATGADNYGPAWSYITPNQFLNPTPGFEYLAFARGATPSAPHDIYYIQVVRSISTQGETGKSLESATTPENANTAIYQIAAGSGNGYGTYTGDVASNGLPFFVGGAAKVNAVPVNQLNDPTTPAGVYSTYRDGSTSDFTYTMPHLTPGARYNVKLHFADPKDNTAGQRIFNVAVGDNPNNFQQTQSVDIIQRVLNSPATLSGLIKDSANTPISGATITVTDFNTGAAVTTTPGTITSTNAAGTNYSATLTGSAFGDAYVVTASAPGFGTESQVVTLPPSVNTPVKFTLQSTTVAAPATITGKVTDSTNGNIAGAKVTVGILTVGDFAAGEPGNRLITYGTATTAGNGTYSVTVPSTLPNGVTYEVTVTPPSTTQFQTLTQPLTPVSGPNTLNFTLNSGAAVGVVGGLVTDKTELNTPLAAGATVVVSSGGTVTAIIQTSGTTTSPGVPFGDGKAINYSAFVPTGAYQVNVNGPNYGGVTDTATVINTPQNGATPGNEFVRADATLVNNNPITAQNTALVIPFNGIVSNTGSIVVSFTAGSGDPPLVNGIEVYSDSFAPASSGFGGFAGVDSPSSPGNLMAIGGFSAGPQVVLNFSRVNFAASYNIYRSVGSPTTSVNNPNSTGGNSASGLEGSVPFANVPNPNGTVTSFTDTNVILGTEYYYQVTAVLAQTITAEGSGNTAIKIVTENNVPDPTNVYDDIYPAWSPFKSIFSITYQTGRYNYATGIVTNGRTVTYNDPTTGHPSEVAISIPDGQTVPATSTTEAYTVAPNYSGILVSQVLNIDPPNLLRFSSTEIVHIQPGNPNDPVNGTATKYGLITGGQSVTATVRLSNRESGIDENNVYLQIKDPDSKYQDSQRIEHKVFAKDENFSRQSNRPANDLSNFSSNRTRIMNFSLDGNDPGVFDLHYAWPSYLAGLNVFPRGAHGGFWATTPNHIFIGKSGGGTNPRISTDARTTPIKHYPFPGPDPARFIPWGPEYECQFIRSAYTNYGQPNADTSPTADYGTPFYLAGVDDQQSFSGAANAPRTEWLKLTRVTNQDNKGGVLYTATWNTPLSGSDFYLDVITYDKATFPNIPANTSGFSGHRSNWRIYDNVGGFSTNATLPNSSNDVLVVSDYALGQKFAGTTFAGQNGNVNLVPKLYGAESYITDVDINILPDTVYAGWPLFIGPPGATQAIFSDYLQPYAAGLHDNNGLPLRTLNGLGVGSYSDPITNSFGSTPQDGVPADTSQQYAIWRILARGPVPHNILADFTPKTVSQPAVADLQGAAAFQNIPAATVLNAYRCVIWLSPYTGDLFTDPGTLDDPGSFSIPGQPDRQSTQTILRSFVQSGGRLFVTGQDVGSTLTLNGTVGNAAGGFLPDVLNANFVSSNGGSNTLVGTNGIANRITGDPGFDSAVGGIYWTETGGPTIPDEFSTSTATFFLVTPNYPYLDNLVLGSEAQSDGSLDQRTTPLSLSSTANLLGQIDTISPTNGAVLAMTYGANGPGAMVYHDDPYNPAGKGTLPNGGTGSRVVYAGFGLEGLSSDAYSSYFADPAFPYFVPPVIPRNPRPEILHNIICYLRTGFVSGNITQTAGSGPGAGQGVVGATVYLIPFSGKAPSTRAVFSTTSGNGGQFVIAGVEPGQYTLAAYKTGYSHGASNNGIVYTVEGDVNVNTGTALTIGPVQPGKIAGTVNDPAGNPIADATVIFKSKDQSLTSSGLTFGGQNAATATNPIGTYSVPNVAVTEYDTATATGPNNPNGKPEYTAAPAPLPPFSTATAPFVTKITVQSNTTTQPVDFVLTPILATISGRIYDKTAPPVGGDNATGGALVAGATVTATDSTGTVVATTAAAADGTYTLTGLPSGPGSATAAYTITATKAGYSATGNTLAATVYLGDMLTGDDIGLTPIAPGVLTGTVTDSKTGAPVPGALVTFTSADKTATFPNVAANASGVYTIPNVPPGSYSGTATGPNNPHGLPTATAGPAQTVTVTSAPPNTTVNFTVTTIPPSIAGTVTDSTTKKPLKNVVITIKDSSGNVVPTTPALIQTATDGTYSTGALPTGTYTLTASLAGYVTQIIGPYTFYNGDAITGNNIALVQAAPGSLSGRVTDKANGLPVAGATVTFVSTDGTVTLTPATTDANGNYTVPSPIAMTNPAGNYIGTATGPVNTNGKPEFQVSAPLNATINPGAATMGVNFALIENPASISGTVTDGQIATAPGVAGVAVTLTDTTGKVVATTTTSATGTYSFNPVPAGQSPTTYTLTASLPSGYLDSTQTVTISLGDTLTLPITLNEKGIIYGLVLDTSALLASPASLANVTITITDTATGATVTTTPTPLTTANTTTAGPDGRPATYQATFIVTPGHTYTVTGAKPNYDLVKSVTITPVKGTPVRADLQLTSSIGLLGGLVSDAATSAPVSGATITVSTGSGTTSTVVATITSSGSTTTAPDTFIANYQGQVTEGTYTVTLTKGDRAPVTQTGVKIVGGKFNRLNFTSKTALPALFTFPAGLQFVSTPYDYSALGFDGVFGTLNTAATGTPPNGNRSHVAVWDPISAGYKLDPDAPADTLRLGVGYWVYLRAATPVTQQGASPTTPYVPISLHPLWNQIGVPNPTTDGSGIFQTVAVSSLKFDNGQGGMISFAQAASTQYHLISPTLYSFDGTSYQPVTATGVLSPWKGYWIKVYAGATLEFPTQLAPK